MCTIIKKCVDLVYAAFIRHNILTYNYFDNYILIQKIYKGIKSTQSLIGSDSYLSDSLYIFNS